MKKKKVSKQLPQNTKRPEVELGPTYAERLENLTPLQMVILNESKYEMRNGKAFLPQFPEFGSTRYTK